VTSGKGNVHIMKTRSSSVSSAPIKPIHLWGGGFAMTSFSHQRLNL
jgi:hypothetical protein